LIRSDFKICGNVPSVPRFCPQVLRFPIQTTPEEAQKVIDFIHQLSTSVDPYKLFSTNCTTVCREALKIIGLVPNDNKDWTPTSFWQHMFGQYADPYWRNSFGWSLSNPDQYRPPLVASRAEVNAGHAVLARCRGLVAVRSSAALIAFLAMLEAGNGVVAEAGMARLLRSTKVTPTVVRYPSTPADAPRNIGSYALACVPGT
jgi:hypothetical protein